MTKVFDKIFTQYPRRTRRMLEIVPGLFSWTLILFSVFGSFFVPTLVAGFILFFDVYWFYKSFSLAIMAYIAAKKIRKAERVNWVKHLAKLKDHEKVSHVIIIPNYKVTAEKLKITISSIAQQTINGKQLYVVLAMEEREKEAKERASVLISEFKDLFGDMFATYHPDIQGEVKGKSSNESYASKQAYKRLVESNKINIDYATISSVDEDSVFDKQYFAYLSYKFLVDKHRYYSFWQSANVTYNNFWDVPAPIRVLSFFGSLHRTALLVQGDRLVSNSTYSLSFKMLSDIGFWDTDVVPEDYRIFFKAFYKLQGKTKVEPIFLKTSMDAAQSTSYVGSLLNNYRQNERWSWGVSDDPLFIQWWLTIPEVPFFRKTKMLYEVLLDHFMWPVNWFIVTIAASILPIVNPVFTRTTLGHELPDLARTILTFTMIALLSMMIIDYRLRPKSDKVSKTRQFLFPLEFIMLPVVGFVLSTLPAIISHTRLLLGKRLEYRVTEKV